MLAGFFGLALVALAACGGSAISPKEALQANQDILGVGGSGTSGPVVPGTDPTSGVPGGAATNPTSGPGGPGSNPTSGPGGAGSNPTSGPGGPGSNPTSGPGNAPPPGVKAGSCTGFKNGKGISDKTITIGNSSDVSGPIPGLFASAQQGTQAYVAYFNATSSICGRKLALTNLDSRTDAGADQTSYQTMCDNVFAAVGSMSAFDSGGAQAAASCGLPDIRTAITTAARNGCGTCFAAHPTGPYESPSEVPDYIVKNYHEASQKAAFLYINVGAAAENGQAQQKAEEKRGMKFLYTGVIDIADFNYGPYVQAMKSKGVEFVQFIGAYQQAVRLDQAMQDNNFHPQVRLDDPSVYDQGFLKTGGSAVEGVFVFIDFTPLEESQPELNLYKQWLQQVSPGAQPTFFGEFAWSAAKLFVQNAIALGGKLNRASLAASFRPIHAWTGGGMHAPMDVGGKHTASCIRFMQVKGGRFVPLGSTNYTCHGVTVGR
jgi:ABC-type branched-subunit amino acid transport system substrate-binding protein